MSHKLTAQIVSYCDILQFSLLRGSGLKLIWEDNDDISGLVLPLTREWIEILLWQQAQAQQQGSPSYEGVD